MSESAELMCMCCGTDYHFILMVPYIILMEGWQYWRDMGDLEQAIYDKCRYCHAGIPPEDRHDVEED